MKEMDLLRFHAIQNTHIDKGVMGLILTTRTRSLFEKQ